jgi:hypothetical protein
MKNSKVYIVTVKGDDQESLTAVQRKLNQWITTEIYIKHEMIPVGNNLIFNITIKKEA